MGETIARSDAPETTARLFEELATYHAFFGRFLECLMGLENVAVLRPSRNRWRFSWEEGASPTA